MISISELKNLILLTIQKYQSVGIKWCFNLKESIGQKKKKKKKLLQASNLPGNIRWTYLLFQLENISHQKKFLQTLTTLSTHLPAPIRLHTGFPGDSDGKEYAFNAGDLGSVPG